MALRNLSASLLFKALLLLFEFIPLMTVCQSEEELLARLDTAQSEGSKSFVYGQLGMHFLMDVQRGIPYAQLSLESAEKSGDELAIGNAHFLIAYIYFHNRHYMECQPPFEEALKFYEIANDLQGMTYVYYYSGYAHSDRGDYYKALAQFEKSLEVAEESKNPQLINISLNSLGPAYCNIHEYGSGLTAAERALLIADSTGFNLSSTYNQMALVQQMMGNFAKSISYLNLSWDTQGEAPNYKNKAANLQNLGNIYILTGQFDSTFTCYSQYQELAKTNSDVYLEAAGYRQFAEYHLALGNTQEAKTNAFKALHLHQEKIDSLQSLNLLTEIHIQSGELLQAAQTLEKVKQLTHMLSLLGQEIENKNNEGLIASKQTLHEEALQFHLDAYLISKKLGNKELLPETFLSIASEYYLLEKYELANNYADSALNVARKTNFRQKLDRIFQVKANSLEKLGEYASALQSYHQYEAIADSLLGIETQKELAKLEIEYKVKEKEAENELLKVKSQIDQAKIQQQTTFAIALVIILSLLIFLSFLLYRNNSRKKRQNVELEKEVELRSRELTLQSQELMEVRQSQELQAAKSRFFANVSHEFRTPLTLIQGTLDNILNRKKVSGDVQRSLERAQRNSQQLLKLISEILDITKLGSNTLPVEETQFDLGELVDRIIQNLEPLTEQKNIRLTRVYHGPKNIQVTSDLSKLSKIMNNLLSNALKFTPRKGKIELEVMIDQEILSIKVSDNGLGIPPAEIDLIFERFYQVNRTETAMDNAGVYQPGSGIGLALCNEYTELLDGRIWAESPGKFGNGTTFQLQIPVKWQKEEPNDELSNDHESTAFTEVESEFHPKLSHEILVVEDNIDLRAFLDETLSGSYTIKLAENGEDALNKLNSSAATPSLIISDVMMPVMDGFTFIESLKKSDKYRQIPTIVLTARADLRDQLNALRIGVDDYITKPFREEDLFRRINQLLRHTEQRISVVASEKNVSEIDSIANQHMQLSEKDHLWLKELEDQAMKLITDFNYTAEDLAHSLNMSRAKFFRKVKSLTGLTVNQYIKEFRLQTARRLLEEGKVSSVKEVSLTVGFKHANYFSSNFEARFGKRPKTYIDDLS